MAYSSFLKKRKKAVLLLLDELLKKYPFASVLGTDVNGYMIVCDFYNQSMMPARGCEAGFCIRVYSDGHYFEYSINDILEKNITNILSDIEKLVNSKKATNNVTLPIIEEDTLVKNFVRKPKGKVYTKDEVLDILKNNCESYKDKDNILNVQCYNSLMNISKCYYSKNKQLTQFYTWSDVRSTVWVRRDDNMKYSYNSSSSNNQEQTLNDLKDVVKTTYDEAIMLLDSTTIEPGVYDIITDSSITGLIVHEAFGHGVEMDMFVKGRAKSMEYIDKRVASNLVTMHDGAKAAECVASYFFDDDGVLAKDTVIIKKGILKQGISDLLTSKELGTTPTGNGRRESYKRKSYTRMTNTFFEKGKSSFDDLVKSVEHGYYLCKTNNGMEDPKSWGIQCTALYGKEIKDGKFTGKVVSPVVMSGYVVDLLESISGIADNFEVDGAGSCGKGYKEWVRVSDGGASLKAKVKLG